MKSLSLTTYISKFMTLNLNAATRLLLCLTLWTAASMKVQAGFTTTTIDDKTAPTISNISVSSRSNDSIIVSWQTNEITDSVIKYAISGQNRDIRAGSLEQETDHLIVLTNLSAATTYQFTVTSKDPMGNATTSAVSSFTTASSEDTTAPLLGGTPQIASITDTTAVISWQSDEYGSSKVLFDYTNDVLIPSSNGSAGELIAGDQLFALPEADNLKISHTSPGLFTTHKINLVGLLPGVVYYYAVQTEDVNGNKVVSQVKSFTTRSTITGATDEQSLSDLADLFPFSSASAITDSDGDGIGDNADIDVDNNGITDTYEAELNAEAESSSANSSEDPFSHSLSANNQLQVTQPSDMTVNATGALTTIELALPEVLGVEQSELTYVVDTFGPFAPGTHTLNWQIYDSNGNSASVNQTVKVIPMVEFSTELLSGTEGDEVTLRVLLNGAAVTYPVSIPYTVAGSATAGEDHDLVAGSVTVEAGLEGAISLTLFSDEANEGPETVEISMGTPTNAVLGTNSQITLTINEENTPPKVKLEVHQDTIKTTIVSLTGGDIVFSALVTDSNSQDSHTFEWYDTNGNRLIADEGDSAKLTLSPTGLTSGLYSLHVVVTDNGEPQGQSEAEVMIHILDAAPELSGNLDSDKDGTIDSKEGFGDDDLDGIPNYLDAIALDNLLQMGSDGKRVLQTEPGLKLRLGKTAFASFTGSALVDLGDIVSHGGEGGALAMNATEEEYAFPEGLIDFEIAQLPEIGSSASIVIPVLAGIPEHAVYRKYLTDIGWQNFVVDDKNSLASAAGEQGACPEVGDNSYQPGLTAGHYCVQLTISDGGSNDSDGVANGIIKDPGGIAVEASQLNTSINVEIEELDVNSKSVNLGDQNTVMLRFRLTANEIGAVIDNLTLTASGDGDEDTTVKKVNVWRDANQNGIVDTDDQQLGQGVYNGQDNRKLTLSLDEVLPLAVGQTDFLITYDF